MPTQELDPQFEALLDYVRENRGFDFTGYKRPSLTRRVLKRMQEVGIGSFGEYQDYLEVHPDEFTQLFNTILINVTGFFRDAPPWDYVRQKVLPDIVGRRAAHEHIRVWSVGCASGEEAYTIAMLLAEAVGPDKLLDRVKIYATDVDDDALAQARQGTYETTALDPVPEELRKRYFEGANGRLAVRKELRRSVIFGRHDLVQDAPISRVDLIVCRNTLMYFNADTQTRIYRGFHFALNPGGYLFLGRSEMLLTRTEIFVPVDLKLRIFVRAPLGGEAALLARDYLEEGEVPLRDAVFESATTAQIVLDPDRRLAAANGRARLDFQLHEQDVGRPFHELELSYRPLELRSLIDRVSGERKPAIEPAVTWTAPDGEERRLEVAVVPLFFGDEAMGTAITFTDISRSYQLQADLERSQRELETAYEEIHSTVEELETTNEELQSTNEELETMNEELQSTNEELEAINTELRERTGQLNQSNAFLESVLGSIRAGVVVLDRDLNIESWNSLAEDMWGLRAEEVRGKSIFALDFGLPVDQLRPQLRTVLSGKTEFEEAVLSSVSRRGKQFECKVLVSPMNDVDGAGDGAILLMEPMDD